MTAVTTLAEMLKYCDCKHVGKSAAKNDLLLFDNNVRL